MNTVPTRNIGTKILFENDRIRVWDFQLAPGESTDLHEHKHDYLFVYVTEDNVLSIDVPNGQNYVQESPDGFVAYFDVGANPDPIFTHRATNVGEKHHRQILVEFLGPSRKP